MNRQKTLHTYFSQILINTAKLFEGTPCWEWQGGKDSNGYSKWKTMGELYAHRVAYRLFVDDIPEGMEVDHECRNRACVSPLHIEAVTPEENRRRRNEAKTHCKKGHEFTEENTYLGRDRKYNSLQRRCRICARKAQQRFHSQNPDADQRYRAKGRI